MPLKTIFDVESALVDDFGFARDPFGLDAINAVMLMARTTHEFVNRRLGDVANIDWPMLQWDGFVADTNAWSVLHPRDRVIGAFVELPVMTYFPTIQVVTAINRYTGDITARSVVSLYEARFASRNPQAGFTIVEQNEKDGTALIQTRFHAPTAPVHALRRVL